MNATFTRDEAAGGVPPEVASSPSFVTVALNLDELLALRQFHADRATTALLRGQNEIWAASENRAAVMLQAAANIPSPQQQAVRLLSAGHGPDA